MLLPRLLLLRPPRRDAWDVGLPVPPLGLAYLAAEVRARGGEVELLDAYASGWSWERTVREVARRRPDVLGLGAMTPVVDVAHRMARLARPHVGRIVLGGPHATALRSAALDEEPAIDEVVVGEGEEVIVPYLSWVGAGAGGDPPPGVATRGRSFRPHTPRRRVESIVWPARDLLPRGAYRYLLATRRGFATMITSRGCPFRCTFCDKSVSGSRWRARPAEDVVDEMAWLARRGTGFVNLYDDNFTLRSRRVAAICEAILARGLDLHWKCEGRVDGVDLPLLRLMRRAGCRIVAYGVESGNADTLARLRKDVTIEQVRAAFAATREAGLRSLAYIILGAPGEDEAGIRNTLRFVREIGADYVQFSTLVALPGTPLRAELQGGGHHLPGPLDSEARREVLSDLPPERLQSLLRRAWLGFYLRPAPLWRLGRHALASGSSREALRLGGVLLRWSLQGRAALA